MRNSDPGLSIVSALFDCVEEDWSLSSRLRTQREREREDSAGSISIHFL